MLSATYLTPAEFVSLAKKVVPLGTFRCRVCNERCPYVWAGSDGLCCDCTTDRRAI